MKKRKTPRGFVFFAFKDSYDIECSLQKSSRADEDFVWLGLDNFSNSSLPEVGVRMLVDRKLAKKLAKKLAEFANTGEL